MSAPQPWTPERVYAWHGLAALWCAAVVGWGLLAYVVAWEVRRPDPLVIEGCPAPARGRP